MKKIRILFEIPEKWVDLESPLGLLSPILYRTVQQKLKEALVEEYVNKVEMPEIKIDPEELKKEVLSKMADKAIKEMK